MPEGRRIDVVVLGRRLGTAEGWDEVDDRTFHFYGFEPADGVALAAADMAFSLDAGVITQYGADGAEVSAQDYWPVLAGLPRDKPVAEGG